MSVYEFYFAPHRDQANAEKCRFSDRIVPYSTEVVCWGRVDKATCPFCSKHVEVYDMKTEYVLDDAAAS